MAATTTSARPTSAARSRVREWQTVTVASAAVSSTAIGLPTMLERPSTTARAPGELGARLLQQLHHPERRAGHEARLAQQQAARGCRGESRRRPWRDRWPAAPCGCRSARGSGSCTRMPSTSGSAFSCAHQIQQRGLDGVGGQLVIEGADARLRRRPWSCCARRPASAGSSPTSTTASPGCTPPPASACASSAMPVRIRWVDLTVRVFLAILY